MKSRDFLKLPNGKYNLSDGIYNYYLEKCERVGGGGKIYFIIEKQSGNILCMFEDNENVFEDYDRYKRTKLTILVTVGGIAVHCKSVYWCISDLKIIPKGSYKNFLQKTEEQFEFKKRELVTV